MKSCKVAVIGATGAVGDVFLRVAEERNFPIDEIRLCASERSVGKKLTFRGEQIEVELCTPELLKEVDFSFISASGDISREIAPLSAANGAIAIDDSSAFRMDPNVPLVVPEVNADDLNNHSGIVSIPNCSTTPLVMVMQALSKNAKIHRVVVDTFQAVSGTGAAAVREMTTQSGNLLNDKEIEIQEYPHQIAFNVLPHIEPFQENGYTREEMKMVNETKKIMNTPEMKISATCVRVPVLRAHSEAVWIETENKLSAKDARNILKNSSGIVVKDEPVDGGYPTPWEADETVDTFVGRIREDLSHPNGLTFWVVADQLFKGAALNSLQIAEILISSK